MSLTACFGISAIEAYLLVVAFITCLIGLPAILSFILDLITQHPLRATIRGIFRFYGRVWLALILIWSTWCLVVELF